MKNAACTLLILLTLTLSLLAEEIIKNEVRFRPGTTGTTLRGQVKGNQSVDYLIKGKAGQYLAVNFKPQSSSAYFNLLGPEGQDEAIFNGSLLGNSFSGNLRTDGVYIVRVYLMGAASQEKKSVPFSLGLSVTGGGTAKASYDKSAELQGVKFKVTSPNKSQGNRVKITPSNLTIDNSPVIREIPGLVTGIDAADINADGSPEIYVYIKSTDGAGTVLALSSNRKKSLSDIHLPSFADNAEAYQDYLGKGEFMVIENLLVHRFPVAGGKTRQISYKLVPGEAGWSFKFVRKDEL